MPYPLDRTHNLLDRALTVNLNTVLPMADTTADHLMNMVDLTVPLTPVTE
jgi:hypothetical protein